MDFFRDHYKARKGHQVICSSVCEANGTSIEVKEQASKKGEGGTCFPLFFSLAFPPSRYQYLACLSSLQKPVEFFCYHGLYAFPLGQRIVKTMGAMEATIVRKVWATRFLFLTPIPISLPSCKGDISISYRLSPSAGKKKE